LLPKKQTIVSKMAKKCSLIAVMHITYNCGTLDADCKRKKQMLKLLQTVLELDVLVQGLQKI